MENIYRIAEEIDYNDEIFSKLYENSNCLIEKIISTGQVTKEGEWLKEDRDEFVILLQGESELIFESGEKFYLKKGDYLSIPSFTKHRVSYTSVDPKCIWLAIHTK